MGRAYNPSQGEGGKLTSCGVGCVLMADFVGLGLAESGAGIAKQVTFKLYWGLAMSNETSMGTTIRTSNGVIIGPTICARCCEPEAMPEAVSSKRFVGWILVIAVACWVAYQALGGFSGSGVL